MAASTAIAFILYKHSRARLAGKATPDTGTRARSRSTSSGESVRGAGFGNSRVRLRISAAERFPYVQANQLETEKTVESIVRKRTVEGKPPVRNHLVPLIDTLSAFNSLQEPVQVLRSARGRRRENMVGCGESGKMIVQIRSCRIELY